MENNELKVVIVTGLSGAGKTQAANSMEDLGYFCVDNLPPSLIPKFTELSSQAEGKIKQVAFVVDVRGGRFFHDLSQALEELKTQGIGYQILFLEAADDSLIRRFKESRRKHPLDPTGRISESIKKEKEMLEELRGKANIIIDTSELNIHQLKEELTRLYGQSEDAALTVTVMSFGYKYGIPTDADLVMDVRFLPNPNYMEHLHHLTGENQEVVEYVMSSPITIEFMERFTGLVKFLLPYYVKEGKTHLVLAIGCTGGQHRSVALAASIGEEIHALGFRTMIKHRDIDRYKGKGR